MLETSACSRSSGDRAKPPTPIARVKGILSIAALKDLPDNPLGVPVAENLANSFIIIREQIDVLSNTPFKQDNPTSTYEIAIPKDKKTAERVFKACLPASLNFIRKHIEEGRRICVVCETGKDLSVGVVLVALQAFFDDSGELDLERYNRKEPKGLCVQPNLGIVASGLLRRHCAAF